MDRNQAAALLAWLEKRAEEEEEKYESDKTFGVGPLSNARDFQTQDVMNWIDDEKSVLQRQFPGLTADYDAPQPIINNSSVPYRHNEIDVSSTDPLHVDFAVALLRFSYRKWKGYRGPEAGLTRLNQYLEIDEDHLANEMGRGLINCSYRNVQVRFDRAFNMRKVAQFAHRILHDVADGDLRGYHPEKTGHAIACLANHNFDDGNAYTLSISPESGQRNIMIGAQEWDKQLVGYEIPFAAPSDDPKKYWFEFLQDVSEDPASATYERVYIGAKMLGMYLTTPSIVGYLRAILDVMLYRGPASLPEEQALAVVKILQLIGHVECDDEDKQRLECDMINALPFVADACRSSAFVYAEYLAVSRTYLGGGRPEPIELSLTFRPEPHQSWTMYPINHDFMHVNTPVGRRVMVIASRGQKRWLIPKDMLRFEWHFNSHSSRRSERSTLVITAGEIWNTGARPGQCSSDYAATKKTVEDFFGPSVVGLKFGTRLDME